MVMEEYKNDLLDKWVGQRVLVKQLTAPELDEELAERIIADPSSVQSALLQSRTAVLEVAGYDQVGVTLLLPPHGDDPPLQTFVPWGAVIELSPMGSAAEPKTDTTET
jgi:hypothetical protein